MLKPFKYGLLLLVTAASFSSCVVHRTAVWVPGHYVVGPYGNRYWVRGHYN